MLKSITAKSLVKQSALLLLIASFLFLAAVTGRAQTAASGARPDRGMVIGGSYATSGLDSVNMQTGNVTTTIPLASLPPMAGGKLGFTLNAYYNSKLWDIQRQDELSYPGPTPCPQPYIVDRPVRSDAGGWSVNGTYRITFRKATDDYGYHIPSAPCDTYSENTWMTGQFYKILLTSPDGAEHELKISGSYSTYGGTQAQFLKGYYLSPTGAAGFGSATTLYSYDGSFLWVVINPYNNPIAWTIYMKDGTKIVQGADGVQRVIDTNNNSIRIFTDSAGTHYQDEGTGREIKYLPDTGQNTSQVQYQTVGGTWETITLTWGQTSVQGKQYWRNNWFPSSSPAEGFTCETQEQFQETISVLRSIEFPQTESGVNAPKFTFGYNSDATESYTSGYKFECHTLPDTYTRTASVGLGELNEINLPSGAKVNYTYAWDNVHDLGDIGGHGNEIARNVVKTKTLTHDGAVDTWTYNINPVAANVAASVNNPDGSFSVEAFYPTDPAFARTYAGSQGLGGLVYRTSQSGKVLTERHWTRMPFSGAHEAAIGTNGQKVAFNPVVDAEYTTLLDDNGQPLKMSAKTFQYDYNGNVLQTVEYDWFSPSGVTRDADGVPTGVPSGATVLRTTQETYYNQASSASSTNLYAKRDITTAAPLVLGAPQETTVGPAITRYSYDEQTYGAAPTKGMVTKVSRWLDYPTGQWIDASTAYDSYGNPTSQTDLLGHVTQLYYDDSTHALPTRKIVDPLNGTGQQTTTTVYDFATGLVTATTDVNGSTSNIDYTNHLLGSVDPFGRPGVMIAPAVATGGGDLPPKPGPLRHMTGGSAG